MVEASETPASKVLNPFMECVGRSAILIEKSIIVQKHEKKWVVQQWVCY